MRSASFRGIRPFVLVLGGAAAFILAAGIFTELPAQKTAEEILKEEGEVTTASKQALQYYLEGRRYHNPGDYEISVAFMKRALSLDPDFALAHRAAAVAYGNQGSRYNDEYVKHLTRAFELRSGISERERLWIQGDYYRGIEMDYDKAIMSFENLIELEPGHSAAHNNLALIYLDYEQYDKAAEHLEVCRSEKTGFLEAYGQLADAYQAQGKYEEAEKVFRDCIAEMGDRASFHTGLAANYLYQGRHDEALAEVEKAIAMDPWSASKGFNYHIMGDLDAAEKEYSRWLETDRTAWQLAGRRWLGVIHRTRGQYKKAAEQAELGVELAREKGRPGWENWFHFEKAYSNLRAGDCEAVMEECQTIRRIADKLDYPGHRHGSLFWKALAQIESNRVKEALRTAEELKADIEGSIYPTNISLYHHLQGCAALHEREYDEAAAFMEKAAEYLTPEHGFIQNHILILYPLGDAYFRAGDMNKAGKVFEKAISMTTGRAYWGDLYSKSLYMLGRVHEKQGSAKEAGDCYRRFLEICGDADDCMTEVADARNRIKKF